MSQDQVCILFLMMNSDVVVAIPSFTIFLLETSQSFITLRTHTDTLRDYPESCYRVTDQAHKTDEGEARRIERTDGGESREQGRRCVHVPTKGRDDGREEGSQGRRQGGTQGSYRVDKQMLVYAFRSTIYPFA